jgi:hypothetical protein
MELGPYAPARVSLLKYRYQPLQGPNWIRIVQLLPSHLWDEPLVCNLIDMDREQLMMSTDNLLNHFYAVSYVWAQNPIFSESLICREGSTLSAIISITPHVAVMLRRFRKSSRPINLWIDALCLDQGGNRAEVQEQVGLMGEIYSEARKVLVWMGDQENGEAEVFAFFRNSIGLTDDFRKD